MRGVSRLLPALMLASLSTQGAAQPAPACLSEPEMRSLIVYAMPEVADQLGKACAPSLPSAAYLVRSRADLVTRYSAAAAPEASVARQAFFKVAGLGSGKLDALDETAVHSLISIGIASALEKGIKPGSCRVVNDVLEQLAPLPPQNMAALISLALREVGNKPGAGDKTNNPFRICGTEEGH
ncbi:MAG TPA: hypothetical protein VF503_11780 [Sphingobium sp.]|uniref:hypothetical protein n=1 Tax=Sphingobium sp. TaxID=1912891 RepID=UPI002ED13243